MSLANRVGIWSDDPDGGDLFWLDALGLKSSLRYSNIFPGGAYNATWQMVLDPRFQHRAVQQGRAVGLSLGGSTIWNGNLDNPVRGDVWQFTALGQNAAGKQYLAYTPTSGNALDLSEAISQANSRGLGWNVVGSLPTVPTVGSDTATVPSASIYIDDALDQVSAAQATPPYWFLDRYGNLTMGPAPTTPGYIILATDTGGGRTLDQFATDAFVNYESASGVTSTVIRSAPSRRFGRFEAFLDETGLGLLASSQADAYGDSFIAKNGARAKFRNSFTLTRGQLQTANGATIDLALALPGVLATMLVTDPDSAGDVALADPSTILLGVTDYDVDSDVLTVTPTDVADDSITGLLSNADSGAS